MLKKDKVKLICLILFMVGIVAVLWTNNRIVRTTHANVDGPLPGFTGAPGEATCTSCHGGTALTGPFSIAAPANYEPGQTYQINVRHTTNDPSRRRWGFELTVLDSNNSKAGNLQNLNNTTQILNNAGPESSRQYIEHTRTGTTTSNWTFNWTAPSTNVGPITFYAAGNQANGDLTSSGDQIYTATATSQPAQAPTPTPTPNVTGLQYYPLPAPIRLLDTRPGEPACNTPGAPLRGGEVRTQNARLTCNSITIPANAQAIVGNATVVNTTPGAGSGFVTLYPSGAQRPTVSNLNYTPGQVVPNSFTVALGSDGAFNIFALTTLHFIVDITGYYAPPGQGALYYHPLPAPVRLLDTRPGETACEAPGIPLAGGGVRTQLARGACAGGFIPANAQAIVGNATVVNDTGTGAGFITLYPSGATRPTVSNLNYTAGQIVPNSFVVGLRGSDGGFDIFALTSTHFIVDITGYYSDQQFDANGQGLLYYPLSSPIRVIDTRAGEPACDNTSPRTPFGNGETRTIVARRTCGDITIAGNAQAIVGNATVVNTTPGAGSGFVTLFPSGASRPTVSNLNYVPGQIVPNSFVVGLGSDGAFQVYALTSLHFIADITGYFAP